MIRSKIKEAALLLFNNNGYDATTMRQIAAEVGITAPSIYFHYESKESIYLEIAKDSLESYTNYVNNFLEEHRNETLEKQYYEMFKARVHFFMKHEETYKFLLRMALFPLAELKGRLASNTGTPKIHHLETLTSEFSKGIDTGILKNYIARQLAMAFYSFITGYIFQILNFHLNPSEDDLKSTWDIFWSGIKD